MSHIDLRIDCPCVPRASGHDSCLTMYDAKQPSWEKFKSSYTDYPALGLSLDLSRINFADGYFESMRPKIKKAFSEMAALESGGIANPDEGRMVGHYWLRNPKLAPNPEIRVEIENMIADVKRFAARVHSGTIRGEGGPFKNLLLIGIGGSVLGPQFVSHALGKYRKDKLRPFFFDNTDPDGMKQTLETIGAEIDRTLCIVASKSGGTSETRNGMQVAKNAFETAGICFERHAVAITQSKSRLHDIAISNKWVGTFPMWDWVGGRTSEMSATGLLPAALQGLDIGELLAGARACDVATRNVRFEENPAGMLALTWFFVGEGSGQKNMVVIPYNDRLELFSRYLQQLIMESLGKRLDLAGGIVNQGMSVFGNKGSTDQHSYVQQLIEGRNDFFLTTIQARTGGNVQPIFVEEGFTSIDFLNAFKIGTSEAIYAEKRSVITITIHDIRAFSVGVLISLFERAVGLYASLIGVNAYHQPGVEFGKKAAEKVLNLQGRIVSHLASHAGVRFTIADIVSSLDGQVPGEQVFKICEFLACDTSQPIFSERGQSAFDVRYFFSI